MLKYIGECLIAALVLGIMGLLRLLPDTWSVSAGKFLGWLLWLARVRRKIVDNNLSIAFPELSRRQRQRLIKRIYLHLGEFFGEWMALGDRGFEQLKDDIELDGIEVLEEAIKAGRGVLCNTAHFGNWEVAARVLSGYCSDMHIIRRELSNRYLDRAFTRLHKEGGFGTLMKGQAARSIIRVLRRGSCVGILVDQSARSQSVYVPFFGRLVSFHKGSAMLARATGAAFIVLFSVPGRQARWRVVFKRVEVKRSEDEEADIRRIVQAYAGLLEEVIRAYPEQWFWFHRKWKRWKPMEEWDGSDGMRVVGSDAP